MIFPPPVPDAAFGARWQSKMARAAAIWQRAFEREDWTCEALARRVCSALRDQRDELVSREVRLAAATPPNPPNRKHPPMKTYDIREDGTTFATVEAESAEAALEQLDPPDRDDYTSGGGDDEEPRGNVYVEWHAVNRDDPDDHASREYTLEQPEPECTHADGHDWQSPIELVGGVAENPGVHGHGGGVIITECCMHCGCRRVTDTWAQRRDTGEQGLREVTYTPGHYADELAVLRLERASRALRDAGYDVSDETDERLILAVSDNGGIEGDDPEAAAALEEIRTIVGEHGCSAEWTGSSNTGSDGETTSDIGVYPDECGCDDEVEETRTVSLSVSLSFGGSRGDS